MPEQLGDGGSSEGLGRFPDRDVDGPPGGIAQGCGQIGDPRFEGFGVHQGYQPAKTIVARPSNHCRRRGNRCLPTTRSSRRSRQSNPPFSWAGRWASLGLVKSVEKKLGKVKVDLLLPDFEPARDPEPASPASAGALRAWGRCDCRGHDRADGDRVDRQIACRVRARAGRARLSDEGAGDLFRQGRSR